MSLIKRLTKGVQHTQYTNYTVPGRRSTSYARNNVTEGSALRLTAVYACIRLLSETMASLPLQMFERADEGRKELASPTWVRRPNGEMTKFRLIERTVASLLLDGNAFWYFERDQLRRIREVWPLHPHDVTVERDPKTRALRYRLARENETRDWRSILHIPFFEGAGGLRGLSPIAACAEAIGFGQALEEYGSKLFGSGAFLSGVLETDGNMEPEDVKALQEDWSVDHAGLENVHKPGVLTGGLKWKPLSMPNDDAQFLESRRYSVEEICRIFRVQPHMVQDLARATFSNIEHQGIDFATHSIRPIAARIEDALLSLVDEGEYLRFNLGGLLRGDMLSRYSAHAMSINTGWSSPNEVREIEDLNRVEGLDEYRRPLNMAAVGAEPELTLVEKVNAASILVRSGYDPTAALLAVGLNPIEHLGLLPTTVQAEEVSA